MYVSFSCVHSIQVKNANILLAYLKIWFSVYNLRVVHFEITLQSLNLSTHIIIETTTVLEKYSINIDMIVLFQNITCIYQMKDIFNP